MTHQHSLLLNEHRQAQARAQALAQLQALQAPGSTASSVLAMQAQADAQAQLQQLVQQQEQEQAQAQSITSLSRLRELAEDSLAGNAVKKAPDPEAQDDRKRPAMSDGDDTNEEEDANSHAIEAQEDYEMDEKPRASPSDYDKEATEVLSIPYEERKLPGKAKKSKKSSKQLKSGKKDKSKGKLSKKNAKRASSLISPTEESAFHLEESGHASSLEGLIAAADAEDKVDQAANTLSTLKSMNERIDWSDSEIEVMMSPGLKTPKRKGKVIKLPSGYKSELPELPEEPLWEGVSDFAAASSLGVEESLQFEEGSMINERELKKTDTVKPSKKKGGRVVSNVLEYPFPIDIWWPSMPDIKKERRLAGEASDEDDFVEESKPDNELPPYRANTPKIRSRLARDTKPGVLEKLPHCKIHRLLMKQSKNLNAPELVYCWQVTELYPNDLMVCCSVCGTWRHAACGGHHRPYSRRENTTIDFVAVCDLCHEEEKILRDFPKGEQRIERQRMEQLRRALSTSAVIRHASFSKYGGTYKWPLGRVAPPKMGGHTRSVHTRHDKAEKQWGDMVTKLARLKGSRPKDVRVRTKELERLLVSVEDAGKILCLRIPSYLTLNCCLLCEML